MQIYTRDEVKYKIVDHNGNMIKIGYFDEIRKAESKAMALTERDYEKLFIVCVKTVAEYTQYDDIGLTLMTKLHEVCSVVREAKLGMIKIILNKYID